MVRDALAGLLQLPFSFLGSESELCSDLLLFFLPKSAMVRLSDEGKMGVRDKVRVEEWVRAVARVRRGVPLLHRISFT